ncbi:24368_t:CDS:2 [Gigaspora rosea]|nr:24368_t:CDS:2 [Gigaspora rosea]
MAENQFGSFFEEATGKLANFLSITYQDVHDRNEWFEELKRMQRNPQLNNIDTRIFRQYLHEFVEKIDKTRVTDGEASSERRAEDK